MSLELIQPFDSVPVYEPLFQVHSADLNLCHIESPFLFTTDWFKFLIYLIIAVIQFYLNGLTTEHTSFSGSDLVK